MSLDAPITELIDDEHADDCFTLHLTCSIDFQFLGVEHQPDK